jgi:hypothetical protein
MHIHVREIKGHYTRNWKKNAEVFFIGICTVPSVLFQQERRGETGCSVDDYHKGGAGLLPHSAIL